MRKITSADYPNIYMLLLEGEMRMYDRHHDGNGYFVPDNCDVDIDRAEETAKMLTAEVWNVLVAATGDRYLDLFISCDADPAYIELDKLLGVVLE